MLETILRVSFMVPLFYRKFFELFWDAFSDVYTSWIKWKIINLLKTARKQFIYIRILYVRWFLLKKKKNNAHLNPFNFFSALFLTLTTTLGFIIRKTTEKSTFKALFHKTSISYKLLFSLLTLNFYMEILLTFFNTSC